MVMSKVCCMDTVHFECSKGLVTNYGEGATKQEGGGMRSFTPTKKGGGKF